MPPILNLQGREDSFSNWPLRRSGLFFPSLKNDQTSFLHSFSFLCLNPPLTQQQSFICHRIGIPADQVLLPCLPLSKSEFFTFHSHGMMTSYHHFLGQIGIATAPRGQRIRISKVMFVKPWVAHPERIGRKENMRTRSKGTKESTVIGGKTGKQDNEGRKG